MTTKSGMSTAPTMRPPITSGSLQPSTVNDHMPSEAGSSGFSSGADHRSVPGVPGAMRRNGRRLPSGPLTTTSAATASCPSRNTVAETTTVSPVTARAGY